jgi:uncharacterized protein YegP (UPF0339 family)
MAVTTRNSSSEEQEHKREHTVRVYQDAAGEWRWTRRAGNGETVADSSEGYTTLENCLSMAEEINQGVIVTVV